MTSRSLSEKGADSLEASWFQWHFGLAGAGQTGLSKTRYCHALSLRKIVSESYSLKTATRSNIKARGRAAHPGFVRKSSTPTPRGCTGRRVEPRRGRARWVLYSQGALRDPGL